MKGFQGSEASGVQYNATISYRDSGRGLAAIWDTQTIASHAAVKTFISAGQDVSVGCFSEALKRLPTVAEGGQYFPDGEPELLAADDFGRGLLILPGRSRKIAHSRPDDLAKRIEHEKRLVRHALKTGRPILAFCGGLYHLHEILGGKDSPYQLVPVTGHDLGALSKENDLRLNGKGQVINNRNAHTVQLSEDSLLKTMMQATEVATNSIHGLALNAINTQGQPLSDIALSSSENTGQIHHLHIAGRTKAILTDDQDMTTNNVEAIEVYYPVGEQRAYAAPIIAVQFHPEATPSGPHQRLIQAMLDAGRTWDRKQALQQRLKEKLPGHKALRFWHKKPEEEKSALPAETKMVVTL